MTDAVTGTRTDPFASLRIREYRNFLLSIFALTLGAQVQTVVVSWQLYSITHDPLSLGVVGLAEAIPFIALALPGGDLVDRVSRKRITLAATVVHLLCGAALLALALRPPAVARVHVLAIYGITGLIGVARAFVQPTRTAIIAELVPRELYANASTWRSSSWQVAAVAGPALGGLLYGFAGVTAAYVAVFVLYVLAVASIGIVRDTPPPPPTDEPAHTRIISGLRFVWAQPVILGALTLDLFAVFLGWAEALLPVFANDILHVGPQGLGVLRAAPAIGAVIVAPVIARRGDFQRAGPTLLIAVALFGASIVGFGLSTNFWLSLVLLAFSGAVDMVSVIIRNYLIQARTPVEMLGRVSAVNSIFIGCANELGAFESGASARLLGTVPSVVTGGCLAVIVVGLTALRVPELRRLRSIQ